MPEKSSPILTVGELNRAIAESLEQSFDSVLVGGEVSNFKAYDSGHWYFSLKDEEGQIRCVMFRGKNGQVGFMPQSGDRIEVSANLGMYVPRGDVQLTVQSMRKAGVGGLYEAFLKLKAKLQKEGLFDEDRKRELPAYPLTIAIVTSAQAAALHDVLSTLARRAPHIQVIIYPTLVQGPDAPAQIIAAIESANQEALADLILLVRGGGSIEDLWAFNDEDLAYAIADSVLPIISGVGHESDFTIADFVADLRAPTPTGAAEQAAPARQVLLNELDHFQAVLADRLRQRLEREAQTLDQLTLRLRHALPNPERMREQLRQWSERLSQTWLVGLQRLKRNQEHWLAQLEAYNPQRTLERGYAVILNSQLQAVRNPQHLNTQDTFQVKLAEGQAQIEIAKLNSMRK
ncbi:MAG: exodeoxyribonuclease VII large subunit [Polynucleobacter sp.]|nr:exodeoxyribonuclease VII large subunit [Polynucleobacter sp.]